MDEKAAPQPWLNRNWRWIALVGLVLALIGGALAVMASISSEPRQMAISAALSNPDLLDRMGEPVHTGWFTRGSIDIGPVSGSADLAIPVSGTKRKGTIYATAIKSAGVWKLTSLVYGADGDTRRHSLLQP